jgi:anti-anti-sigma factor
MPVLIALQRPATTRLTSQAEDTMPLNLHAAEKPPGSMRVTLEGRLDADTTHQLEALLEPLLRRGFREIRFDLTGLHYISSMGLRVFLKTAKSLRGSATKLVLTGMQPQIRKVFEIGNMLPSFSIFASVAEADEYFDHMQRQVLEGE